MKTKIDVRNKENKIICSFTISLWERTLEDQQLDALTFYLAYAKKIHDLTVEMSIDSIAPFSHEELCTKKAHIHQGNDSKWYICYPAQLSMDKALAIVKHWCLITAFHMNYQADISYFESFDIWLTQRRSKEEISAFAGFGIWIEEMMGWKTTTEVEDTIDRTINDLKEVMKK